MLNSRIQTVGILAVGISINSKNNENNKNI